jgi:hypothetical protein
MKNRFDDKVIMFEETFLYMNAIILCYGKYKYVVLQWITPKTKVWVIAKSSTSTWSMLYWHVW